jgi:hypothetical protein
VEDKKFTAEVGERGRNRTFNLLIKSQLLCQLSYAPLRKEKISAGILIITNEVAKPASRFRNLQRHFADGFVRFEAAVSGHDLIE